MTLIFLHLHIKSQIAHNAAALSVHNSEDPLVENDRHTIFDDSSLLGDEMGSNIANSYGVESLVGASDGTVQNRLVCDCCRSCFHMT